MCDGILCRPIRQHWSWAEARKGVVHELVVVQSERPYHGLGGLLPMGAGTVWLGMGRSNSSRNRWICNSEFHYRSSSVLPSNPLWKCFHKSSPGSRGSFQEEKLGTATWSSRAVWPEPVLFRSFHMWCCLTEVVIQSSQRSIRGWRLMKNFSSNLTILRHLTSKVHISYEFNKKSFAFVYSLGSCKCTLFVWSRSYESQTHPKMFVSYLFGDEIMMNSIFLWEEIWKSAGMAFMNWFAPLMVLGTTVLMLMVHWNGVYSYTKRKSTHVALHTIVLSIEGVLLRPLFSKASFRGDRYSGQKPNYKI